MDKAAAGALAPTNSSFAAQISASHLVADRADLGSYASRKNEVLEFLACAIARIHHGEGAESALREVRSFLLDLLGLVERDPGIEVAANDLYEAAAALVSAHASRSPAPDARRSRLLRDAARRLGIRLAARRQIMN